MARLILRIMINALSIGVAVKTINGIAFTGEWWKLIIIGAIFGCVNAMIKPIVKLLTLPLIVLSLGLFTLVVNSLMLALTAALSDTFRLGLSIDGFFPALWGALVVSLVSMLLTWVTGVRRSGP